MTVGDVLGSRSGVGEPKRRVEVDLKSEFGLFPCREWLGTLG